MERRKGGEDGDRASAKYKRVLRPMRWTGKVCAHHLIFPGAAIMRWSALPYQILHHRFTLHKSLCRKTLSQEYRQAHPTKVLVWRPHLACQSKLGRSSQNTRTSSSGLNTISVFVFQWPTIRQRNERFYCRRYLSPALRRTFIGLMIGKVLAEREKFLW